jgi:O-antigen/teichoic acid export membrane protein
MSDCPENPPHALRADTLAQSVLILLALLVVQRLVGFVRVVLFCRWLDPNELGQWDLAFGFLMLAGPISVLALTSSFGRYVEHYRQKQQLRAMLKRIAAACGAMGLLAAGLLCLLPGTFAELIFGSADEAGMVPWVAATLLAVLGYNYFIDLFTALRNARMYAGLQLVNSVAFAAFGIALLCAWRPSAGSVVLAYGAAMAVSCAWGAAWFVRGRRLLPGDGPPPPHREFWARLVPFTASVWVTSLMANLFDLCGRWLVAHCWPGSDAEALAAVGDYHSSRVMPILLVSVAQLIAPMILPHLSHDWEQGRRERVGARLNLHLKLMALAMTAGALAVLWFAPFLFRTALAGKYAGGLAVLPMTLTYCTWFGLFAIAQNYLLCAERARWNSVALAAGLGINATLGLLLLPRLGLQGAVLAATAGNLGALALVLALSCRRGLRLSDGTLLALTVPAVLSLGPWATLAALAAVVAAAAATERVFSADEKREIGGAVARVARRLAFRPRVESDAPAA